MKKYLAPEMEIHMLQAEDIVRTSGYDLPETPFSSN